MKKMLPVFVTTIIIIFILFIATKYLYKDDSKNNETDKNKNNSDLVCYRNTTFPDEYQEQELITIKFNEKSIIKEYEQKYTMKFNNSDAASKYYEELKSNNEFAKIDINNSEVNYSYLIVVNKEDNKYFGKNKKEIKDIYVNELYYKCE